MQNPSECQNVNLFHFLKMRIFITFFEEIGISMAGSIELLVCFTTFSNISSVKNKFNGSSGVWTCLIVPLGPGLFFEIFIVPSRWSYCWLGIVSQLTFILFLASAYLDARFLWVDQRNYCHPVLCQDFGNFTFGVILRALDC